MNSNIRALLKVQLILAWRNFTGRVTKNSKFGFLLIPLFLLAFGPLLAMMTSVAAALYFAGAGMGQGQVLLTLALTGGQLACLMFGIFYVISAFFFSNDLRILVPMPIRPSEIVLAKFISILVGEYATMAPLVLPAFVVYGIFAKVSWTYIPFALVIYLLLPVVPLVIASLFSLALMRVTNLKRNRDLFRVIGALFGVGLGLGINMLSRFGGLRGFGPNNNALQQALAQQQNLINAVGRYFPTSLWATEALQAGSPLYGAMGFLMFTVVAVVALVLLMYVAEKIFFGGLLGGEETRSSGRVLSRDELARETGKSNSPLRALLWKEIRLLNRTPSFLMSALLPVVIMPVFAVLPLLQDREMLSKLPNVGRFAASPLVPVIAMGVLLWMNAMSNVAATAISREGRHFWISRSLPVSPRVQVLAKLLHSMIFTSLNIVVICAGLGYMGLLSPRNLAAVVVGGVLASIATASGGILVDLMRPHLTWTDPQQAMKGNMNVLFALILILLMAGVLAGVTALMYVFARQMVLPAIILLFGIEAFVLFRMAGSLAERRYLEYED